MVKHAPNRTEKTPTLNYTGHDQNDKSHCPFLLGGLSRIRFPCILYWMIKSHCPFLLGGLSNTVSVQTVFSLQLVGMPRDGSKFQGFISNVCLNVACTTQFLSFDQFLSLYASWTFKPAWLQWNHSSLKQKWYVSNSITELANHSCTCSSIMFLLALMTSGTDNGLIRSVIHVLPCHWYPCTFQITFQ